MKVKFANRIYEVLFTKELAGLTMYAVEDEPNNIDWLINVEVIDDDKKELKKIENEIEIPFGAKDSELQEVTYYIPTGFHAEIDDNKVVIKKGEKPAAWSEEDEKTLDRILTCIEYCKVEDTEARYNGNSNVDPRRYDPMSAWLKSLRPKNHWKPSKEQMKALEWQLNNTSEDSWQYKATKDLFEQLKQL